ncbi:retrovirus-related pol polyprotein from transposon TNT 1-94 [Tanacetum coccineum]
MLSPKPESFYYTEQKMALGYQNSYLKQAQQKQQSLYNGKVLLEKHDPPAVYDSEETLQLAQARVFVSQKAKSREELYFSNTSKTAIVSKSISIPDEEFSDDTSSSVARKFLNEVKRTIVTLQRVVKQKMTLDIQNWSSTAHQEIHKIGKDETFPIVKQVDARVQNFEIQFLKEAAKFVRDFKSLAKEANESLAKHKALEFVIERLLRAVVCQDIMSIVQNHTVVETSDLQNELDRTKERFENCVIPKVVETNDLSKPVTSNSVPTTTESKVVTNDKVIAPGMFRVNSFKTFREDKFMPINKVRASVRINPITVSQPHVITKKHVNSDSNGLSSTGVDNTSKTRRPRHRRNTKNDRVPSASKSSCIKNKVVEVEEHHRNLLLSENKKHISFECNNVKLAIRVINLKLYVLCKFLGTIHIGNDHVATILVYDLEVTFKRNTCFVRNLEGVDLLKGNRTTNLYTINLHEMASASPICLMARATSTKSWLWHQRLSHLNFDTINDLAKNDLVTGLPKFKYHKEHLCPSCEQGKSKKASHPPKPVPNSKQRLHLLHMDLCGPMRFESINWKLYILVIVDDYSRYTWVHFLRSKDEAPKEIKIFLKKITVLIQALVIIVRTDNDTEFKNQVLQEYFNSVGISHQASSVRTCQQNRVVEPRNWTLVEAARTMLIFSRALLFLWTKAIATACYTRNRSIIHRRFNKTPYELINDRKPNISFLHEFGALCYPKNNREDIRKLGAKGDIGFFISYSATSCAYKVKVKENHGDNESAIRTALAAQAPQVL